MRRINIYIIELFNLFLTWFRHDTYRQSLHVLIYYYCSLNFHLNYPSVTWYSPYQRHEKEGIFLVYCNQSKLIWYFIIEIVFEVILLLTMYTYSNKFKFSIGWRNKYQFRCQRKKKDLKTWTINGQSEPCIPEAIINKMLWMTTIRTKFCTRIWPMQCWFQSYRCSCQLGLRFFLNTMYFSTQDIGMRLRYP